MPPKKDGRKASLKQRHADAADARSRGAILANDRDDDGGQWEFTPAAQALVDAEDAQLDAEVASDEEPLEPSAKAARLATNPGVEVKRRNHAAAERRSSHRRKAPAMPTLADWLHRGRGIEKSGPQRPGTTEANSSAILGGTYSINENSGGRHSEKSPEKSPTFLGAQKIKKSRLRRTFLGGGHGTELRSDYQRFFLCG